MLYRQRDRFISRLAGWLWYLSLSFFPFFLRFSLANWVALVGSRSQAPSVPLSAPCPLPLPPLPSWLTNQRQGDDRPSIDPRHTERERATISLAISVTQPPSCTPPSTQQENIHSFYFLPEQQQAPRRSPILPSYLLRAFRHNKLMHQNDNL